MLLTKKMRKKITAYAVRQHALRRKMTRNKCRLIDAFMGKDFCSLAWSHWVINK